MSNSSQGDYLALSSTRYMSSLTSMGERGETGSFLVRPGFAVPLKSTGLRIWQDLGRLFLPMPTYKMELGQKNKMPTKTI